MNDGSGLLGLTLLGFFNPDWSLQRTQLVFDLGLDGSQDSLPLEVMWDTRCVYELPTSEAAIGGTGSSSSLGPSALLPTPSAFESDPSDELADEMRDHYQANARMYLPGRKYHSQQTLRRVAALLPTPTTSDVKGPSPNHGGTTSEAIAEAAKTWEHRGTNLPEAVQRSRGATTNPPSAEPRPCSDQPQLPWTAEGG